MKNTEVFDTLSRRDNVLGLGLCGSWRMNTHDRYSDVDVWVFVDPATPLSDAYCLDTLIPHGLRMEVLSEGRDDSLVPFSVYNVLTEDGILNLKFISLKVLTDFVHAVPSYDHGYLDDLENYQTMQVLFERQDILSSSALSDREGASPFPASVDDGVGESIRLDLLAVGLPGISAPGRALMAPADE
ncbi:nucleotidyltransferase domain-containing protein [Streptosporangium lutulentum]